MWNGPGSYVPGAVTLLITMIYDGIKVLVILMPYDVFLTSL